MSRVVAEFLRHLDHCVTDRMSISKVKAVLDKLERCCIAVEKKLNIADVINDSANFQSLLKLFGKEDFNTGIELILKTTLSKYQAKSFTIRKEVLDVKKIEFLYRTFGGWKQFDMVFSFITKGHNPKLKVLNPQNRTQWSELTKIPAGTLIVCYVRARAAGQSAAQEKEALARIKAAFDLVQTKKDLERVHDAETKSQRPSGSSTKKSAPATSVSPAKRLSASTPSRQRSAPAPRSNVPRVSSLSQINRAVDETVEEKPNGSLEVVVNKMDTFIHAGNSHLIISHFSKYSGEVKMFVYRGDKVQVQLDADSIWGAEIRNGERVIYEFFGPKPSSEYLKELAHITNKYTQMDKVANE